MEARSRHRLIDNQPTSDDRWAAEELAAIELHDARLNRRCQELAVAFGHPADAPINQACEDWADTKAAYRFFDNANVAPEKILKPHSQRTVERLRAYPLVLAVQDSSYLDYTHHPHTQGLGEIGSKKLQLRGFGLHTTLAVTPQGLPLGVLAQSFFTRPLGKPPRKTPHLRKQPIEAKESYRWLAAFRHTQALAPAGVEVVTVCDREADFYEMFAEAQENQAGLLVRAKVNRRLAEAGIGKLWDKLEGQDVAGYLQVEVAKTEKQAPRTAQVAVRFAPVRLEPPWRPAGQKLPVVALHAILVSEVDAPADVAEPIEWLLLVNRRVDHFDQALEVVGWYGCRWQSEVFHKILKSGCRVEDCRLQTADRLRNFIALKSVIAWRIHWLTYLNRVAGDGPCTRALTAAEWQALYLRIHKSKPLPDQPPTLRQAVRWIAQLGGFLGRKADGEPGVTVVWRGWQRLQDMADTWYLLQEHS